MALGHSTFVITTPGGKRIVTDPWLEETRSARPIAEGRQGRSDSALARALDHSGSIVPVSRATNAPIVAIHELSLWLEKKGLHNVKGMGIGGVQTVAGLEVSMTPAVHSSSVAVDGDALVYLGAPTGFVVRLEDGRAFYFAGDTALFGDMKLIAETYAPQIAFLPIGDHYTMGPDAAARACQLLGVRRVVPMHYGTFPVLTGTPERLKHLVEPFGVDVLVLHPGETAE